MVVEGFKKILISFGNCNLAEPFREKPVVEQSWYPLKGLIPPCLGVWSGKKRQAVALETSFRCGPFSWMGAHRISPPTLRAVRPGGFSAPAFGGLRLGPFICVPCSRWPYPSQVSKCPLSPDNCQPCPWIHHQVSNCFCLRNLKFLCVKWMMVAISPYLSLPQCFVVNGIIIQLIRPKLWLQLWLLFLSCVTTLCVCVKS